MANCQDERMLQYHATIHRPGKPIRSVRFPRPFLEFILKHSDKINDAVAISSSPNPYKRLKQIAGAMQNTIEESLQDTVVESCGEFLEKMH